MNAANCEVTDLGSYPNGFPGLLGSAIGKPFESTARGNTLGELRVSFLVGSQCGNGLDACGVLLGNDSCQLASRYGSVVSLQVEPLSDRLAVNSDGQATVPTARAEFEGPFSRTSTRV